MLLAIDIGNTNVTLGIFADKNGKYLKGPVKTWRLSTNKSETSDEYGQKIMDLFHYNGFDSAKGSAIAIASVVPVLDQVFKDLCRDYFSLTPFFVKNSTAPCKILYDNPKEVGADRIADAVAAYDRCSKACIIIDFGTATTFDCVDENGSYLGGVITPGPAISAESLAKKTAKLPLVAFEKPKRSIGKSTIESIQSGLYYGYIGLINGILENVISEMGGKPIIYVTGGLAGIFYGKIRGVKEIVPELTIEGIRLIHEKFKDKKVDNVDNIVNKAVISGRKK